MHLELAWTPKVGEIITLKTARKAIILHIFGGLGRLEGLRFCVLNPYIELVSLGGKWARASKDRILV